MGRLIVSPSELMHASSVKRPFHREGWVYEEKPDGYRILIVKDRDDVRLVSRRGREHTQRFVGVTQAVRALRVQRVVFDGEVARYDQRFVSRFEWLRSDPEDEIATPPMFIAFDLLQLGTDDLRTHPLQFRRERLEDLLDGASRLLLPVRRLADDGLKAWQQVLDHGWEGLVAKDPKSHYVAGRSLRWLKVKQREYRVKERGWE